MSNVSNKVFSHTHYGVSTIAAVLYAIAWLLGNQVRAADDTSMAVLPALVVTGHQIVTATLEPVIVTGYRPQAASQYAMLSPVIVRASRNSEHAEGPTMQPAVATGSFPVVSASRVDSTGRSKGVIAKVRNWVVSALLK